MMPRPPTRFEKLSQPGCNCLIPTPVVLVSCGRVGVDQNLIAISWAGMACSSPPILGLGIGVSRHSNQLIRKYRDFVVNIASTDLIAAVELCGSMSGRSGDKFLATGLTPVPAETVGAPIVAECHVNMECRVIHVLSLGSHDLFLGEVTRVHTDPSKERETALATLTAAFGDYFGLARLD